jgi:hypothetical protein
LLVLGIALFDSFLLVQRIVLVNAVFDVGTARQAAFLKQQQQQQQVSIVIIAFRILETSTRTWPLSCLRNSRQRPMGSAGVKSWTATMVEHRAPAMAAGEYEEEEEVEEEDINMVKTRKKENKTTTNAPTKEAGLACRSSSRSKQCDFFYSSVIY